MNAISGGSYILKSDGDLELVERTLGAEEVVVEETTAKPSKAKAPAASSEA